MGFFYKLKEGLKKTKQSVFGQVHELFKNMRKVDEDLLEELEELLIMADVGCASSEQIIARLRNELKERKIEGGDEALEVLKEILCEMMGENTALALDTTPSVIL
ncbi:MAG: signal recognition particle receptor subunit alpha, partial [Clostridia bacterium]|nr:signal recognition particle receptor subunit alpha [Clostridia bacterium]